MIYKIALPTYPNYHILDINKTSAGIKKIIMIPISEEEEAIIDNIGKNIISFTRGKYIFSVSVNDVYCYGETDFNDESILAKIDKFNFLNYLGFAGVPINANYDYETHSCMSTKNKCLWAETWSPAELSKMAHGYLGKPERILLFSQLIKK